MAKVTQQQVNDVVEYLQGSCNSIDQALEAHGIAEQNGDELIEGIVNHIERCERCDWWHEISEIHDMGDELVCDDCWQQATEDGEVDSEQ